MKTISLTSGELNYPAAALALEATRAAIDGTLTHYPSTEGVWELRAALAEHYRSTQADIMPENVLITSGARHAIYNVLKCTLQPRPDAPDEVIVPTPYWFSFPDLVTRAKGELVPLPTHQADDFAIDPERLAALITPRTKLFILTNPCNPTGKIYSAAEIDALVEVLERFPHVHVLTDEIYDFISFEGGEPTHLPDGTVLPSVPHLGSWQQVADRVVTAGGFSKCFSMAGWRVGYLVAAENLIQRFKTYQEVTHSGVSVFSQRAALAAWNDRPAYLGDLMGELRRRRALALELLGAAEGLRVFPSQGTYYLFPDVSAYFGCTTPAGRVIRNATDLTMYLFADARVQVLSGDLFGDARHVRLSFGVKKAVLREGLQRIVGSLRKLGKPATGAAVLPSGLRAAAPLPRT
ncbi:MAG: aminotransferase class I/II-fold pyridoxal phosphate-dependent enzyme [Catalinimonas sp.]